MWQTFWHCCVYRVWLCAVLELSFWDGTKTAEVLTSWSNPKASVSTSPWSFFFLSHSLNFLSLAQTLLHKQHWKWINLFPFVPLKWTLPQFPLVTDPASESHLQTLIQRIWVVVVGEGLRDWSGNDRTRDREKDGQSEREQGICVNVQNRTDERQ